MLFDGWSAGSPLDDDGDATRRDKSFEAGVWLRKRARVGMVRWVVCRGGAGRRSYGVAVVREVATPTTAMVTAGIEAGAEHGNRNHPLPQSGAAVLYLLVLLPRQHRLCKWIFPLIACSFII